MKNKIPPRIVVNLFTVKREHVPKKALYNSCMVICINIMQERYRDKLTFHDMPKKLLEHHPAIPPGTNSAHQGRELTPLPKVLTPTSQFGTPDDVHPRAIAI